MRVSAEGLAFIKSAEGLERRLPGGRIGPYLCPAGVPTIGYGTTEYPNGRRVTLDDEPISRSDAETFLRHDVDEFSDQVFDLLRRQPTQSQFDALVSLAYNIGITAFGRSTVLSRYNRGDIQGAAAAFMMWVRVGNQRNAGLVRRRTNEAQMFLRDAPSEDMPQAVNDGTRRNYVGPIAAGTAGLGGAGLSLDNARDIMHLLEDALPFLRPVTNFISTNPVWAIRALCAALVITAVVWGIRRWQRSR